jgi:NIPSNAP
MVFLITLTFQTKFIMKHHLLFCLFFFPIFLFSQKIKLDAGTLKGAAYDIQIPENWNKKLVMYAQGYGMPMSPHNAMGTTTGKKPTEIIIPTPTMVEKDTLCYELRVYTCNKGKLNDLLRRFRNHTTKIFEKHGMTNVGYWTPLDNTDDKLYYVLSYPNRAAREASWAAFSADTTWQRVWRESEAKGDIVSKIESIFLKTTDFSPNNFKNSLNSGIWELRIYHTTPNNLGNLLDRFRGFTVNRFAEYGMTNKIYWTPTDADQGRDNMLYYFLTHPSPEAQKVAFDKFRADKEWIATRNASEIKGGGSLTTKVESILMFPVDFSTLK